MEGQTEIVEILFKFGSDVNMQGGIYRNALPAAAAVAGPATANPFLAGWLMNW
jgi:hypothetical protein